MLSGAIVGFGNVAEFGHWPAYARSNECRIVAVVDPSADRRNAARSRDASIATVSSVEELSGIDFIDICTPPAHHAAPMQLAIEHGWCVLCEKPLLLDLGVAEAIRERATNAIVPVHNWKYAPIVLRASQMLRTGAIGALRRVKLTTLRSTAAVAVGAENWRHDPQLAGGGILIDHGWHAIYLALHWFGERVSNIQAQLHRANQGGVEDEAVVRLNFPSGEAEIALSWNASRRENRIELIGERGVISIDDDTLRVEEATEHFDSRLSAGSHHADWFAAMLPDVLAAFGEPTLARPLLDEAVECLRVIREAYASALWCSESFVTR